MPAHNRPEDKKGLSLPELRPWDMTLLGRYSPRPHLLNSSCTLCALGPCDLKRGRRGACGQEIEAFAAREALILAVTGASAHASHARDVVERLIADRGHDFPLSLGDRVHIMMPITMVLTGMKPVCIGDMLPLLQYIDSQIVRLLSATHFGGESDIKDLVSKILHAGTMDILAMEVADVAQISGYGFPCGDEERPLLKLGSDFPFTEKPLILCIGHNSDTGYRIVRLVESMGLDKDVEVAGLCCTAHDMARGSRPDALRVAGNIREQLTFIRSGRADVVVIDQQCIRHDILSEVLKTGAFFISTTDINCGGLPDVTATDKETLIGELNSLKPRGIFISDPEKASIIALEIVRRYGRVSKASRGNAAYEGGDGGDDRLPELFQKASACNNCGLCSRHCPLNLPVSDAVYRTGLSNRDGEKGLPADDNLLSGISLLCIYCGRCETACPQGIPVMTLTELSCKTVTRSGWMRRGRGPVDDYEIKSTGPSIVLGDIPGVVAFLTCPEYPDGRDSAGWMAGMLAERDYIVLSAGCAAMDLGMGEASLYSRFGGSFDMGGVINTGSCVSSSHAIGALIKVASIFLHRRLERNYVEIADYILNRIGAAGVLWGGITPKSFSAASGAARLGIPVLFGPQGLKFRITLEGNPASGGLYDARSGREAVCTLLPPNLFAVSEKKEEALIEIVRLCMRPNDTTRGRQRKLKNYIELSRTLLGKTPEDISLYVRVHDDLPDEFREELVLVLESGGWRPSFIPDPTLLRRLIRNA